MSGQFERFRPLKGLEIDLVDKGGISPSEAGREDARAAMKAARAILEQAARDLKLTKNA
jgi:hypothetical protein